MCKLATLSKSHSDNGPENSVSRASQHSSFCHPLAISQTWKCCGNCNWICGVALLRLTWNLQGGHKRSHATADLKESHDRMNGLMSFLPSFFLSHLSLIMTSTRLRSDCQVCMEHVNNWAWASHFPLVTPPHPSGVYTLIQYTQASVPS